MKRAIRNAAFCLVVLALLLSGAGRRAGADSLYVKKIVSVVLDDSGSMDGDRWNYAIYALQNLAAMLNPGDTLFVTRLNQGGTVQYDVTDAGLNGSIQRLQKEKCTSHGTPVKAVLSAFEHLKRQQSEEPTTEYWLVVMTDGAFDGFYSTKYRDLSDAFNDFLSQAMPNGSNPRLIYLNIASGDNVKSDYERGLYTYYAKDAAEINNALSDVSDFVTGRKRFTKSEFRIVDDRTIRISSEIPLANILLLQSADAKVTGVKSDRDQALTVTRSAQTHQRINFHDSMSSTVSRIECLQGNIAAGTYTITFDRALSLDDVTVLFEPALEINLIWQVKGRAAQSQVYAGDELTASYRICESGTNVEIPLRVITGATAGVTVLAGQNSKTDDPSLSWTLTGDPTRLTAWLDIPGFRRLEDTSVLNPGPTPPKTGTSRIDDVTITLGEYRNSQISYLLTCYNEYYDGKGNMTSRTVLTTRQELIDNRLSVDTRLPYDRNALYGSDGKLHLQFYDDGTVNVGTWPVRVYWGDDLKSEFNIIITPSVYTVEASPSDLTLSLSDFMSTAHTVRFTLTEDGKWPASCREHGLEVTGSLPGSLSFDSDGNGIFTFSRDQAPAWGDYLLTPSLKKDILESPQNVTVRLTRSDAVIHVEPSSQSRKQSELSRPAVFTARMTADGVSVPFEADKYTVTQSALQEGMKVTLQNDGTLRIELSGGIDTPAGQYPLEISAEGGAGRAVLEVSASEFAITAAPARLDLVTDDLEQNRQGICFSVTADGRSLTEAEIRQLSPKIDRGALPDGSLTCGNGTVTYTPSAPPGWTLLPDGVYPVVLSLQDGTQASADVVLTMVKYEILPVRDGQTLSRESLVGSSEAVVFEIRKDGRRLTREEVLEVGFTLLTDDRHRNWVELTGNVNVNGEVEVVPGRTGRRFRASFAPLGDLPVTLTVKVTSGTALMHIRRGDFFEEWLPYRIEPALFLLWMLGYVFKWAVFRNKFYYRASVYKCGSCVAKANNIELEHDSWSQHCRLYCAMMLIPWIRDRKQIRGSCICLESAGSGLVRYRVKDHGTFYRYFIADAGDILPYEDGKIPLNTLEEIDPAEEETDPAEEKENSRKKHRPKWHSLPSDSCIVFFDGDQYSIYCIRVKPPDLSSQD